MKVVVNFKSDNGYLPYCITGDPAWRLCSNFGPTLYPKSLGGKEPIFPLPESITIDLTISSFFSIFSFKSMRIEIVPPDNLILTVPGFKASWLEEYA